VTALMAWPSFHPKMETEVDNQVAAPAETRTPNLHRANIAPQECGWKGGDSGGSARKKQRDQPKPRRTHLTPTGLLMEGHYTHRELATGVNECYGEVSTDAPKSNRCDKDH